MVYIESELLKTTLSHFLHLLSWQITIGLLHLFSFSVPEHIAKSSRSGQKRFSAVGLFFQSADRFLGKFWPGPHMQKQMLALDYKKILAYTYTIGHLLTIYFNFF